VNGPLLLEVHPLVVGHLPGSGLALRVEVEHASV
jgi:hypothetical protein